MAVWLTNPMRLRETQGRVCYRTLYLIQGRAQLARFDEAQVYPLSPVSCPRTEHSSRFVKYIYAPGITTSSGIFLIYSRSRATHRSNVRTNPWSQQDFTFPLRTASSMHQCIRINYPISFFIPFSYVDDFRGPSEDRALARRKGYRKGWSERLEGISHARGRLVRLPGARLIPSSTQPSRKVINLEEIFGIKK